MTIPNSNRSYPDPFATFDDLVALDPGRSVLPAEMRFLGHLTTVAQPKMNPDNVPLLRIIELGSYRAQSTVLLAKSCLAGKILPRVYAIDYWLRGKGKISAKYRSVQTWQIFLTKLARFNITEYVVPFMGSTQEGRQWWSPDTKAGMLFIDAAHDFNSVRDDFLRWKNTVYTGGVIAFHDYAPKFGVMKLVDGLIAADHPGLELIDRVEKLVAFKVTEDNAV